MNREIEYITNVTASTVLDETGVWRYNGHLPDADEIVIRQITYNSTNAFNPIWNIWANLGSTTQIVGTVCASIGFTSCPGTRIHLRTPPSQCEFQLRSTMGLTTTGANLDFVAINFDLIKYRK
jgi:hypothetical protein